MLTILLTKFYLQLSFQPKILAKDNGKTIQSLDSNKSHGHDNIRIYMLKVCGDSICATLEMSFKQALLTAVFPTECKKGKIVPIRKKSDKLDINNYFPVSLLPICGKIFERIIFNEMFNYFSANKLISKNQTVFQPSNSCINQILSITPEILISFGNGLEVRSAFVDIYKAFNQVWIEGLIFKLKQLAFLVNFFTTYLIF